MNNDEWENCIIRCLRDRETNSIGLSYKQKQRQKWDDTLSSIYRKNLRKNDYAKWEDSDMIDGAFVPPESGPVVAPVSPVGDGGLEKAAKAAKRGKVTGIRIHRV